MGGGYIKLHRGIRDWRFRKNPIIFSVWVELLTLANYEPKKWNGIIIERGQCVISVKSLAESCGLSVQNVRTALANLQTNGCLAVKSTNKFSIVTICNYEIYQGVGSGNQQTSHIEAKEQTNNYIRSKEGSIEKVTTSSKDVFSGESKKTSLKESYSSFFNNVLSLCPIISERMALLSVSEYIALKDKYSDSELLSILAYIENYKDWHSMKSMKAAINRYLQHKESLPSFKNDIP